MAHTGYLRIITLLHMRYVDSSNILERREHPLEAYSATPMKYNLFLVQGC